MSLIIQLLVLTAFTYTIVKQIVLNSLLTPKSQVGSPEWMPIVQEVMELNEKVPGLLTRNDNDEKSAELFTEEVNRQFAFLHKLSICALNSPFCHSPSGYFSSTPNQNSHLKFRYPQ